MYLQKLKERHREIGRLLVAGMPQREIAGIFGLTESRLSIIINSPIFQEYLSTLSRGRDSEAVDFAAHIHRIAERGLKKIEKVLDTTQDDKLATDIGFKALNLDGYVPIQKHQIASVSLTPEDVRQIKEEQEREVVVK